LHPDTILAVCAVFTLAGGVALALIQVGALTSELKRLREDDAEMKRDRQVDADRIQAAYQREIDGIHRELSDLRGQAAMLRRPR
jgi:hypothetical protein